MIYTVRLTNVYHVEAESEDHAIRIVEKESVEADYSEVEISDESEGA